MKPIPTFLFLLFLLTAVSPVHALSFGINKVRYHAGQKWRVLETEHFDLYHHPKAEALAQTAARYAENAFLKVSQALDYVPSKRIPLFLYATGLEFQETNIIPSFLPEGVGGFTEAYKNRIVVPANGSLHELETVIVHELVHAFQYNLIYGEGWRSSSLFKSIFVPTWVMEGSAEWIAGHWESQGEMVLRDAILNDRIIPLNLLGTFEHFEQVYMAYKQSHSILEYAAQVYGRDKVPQMVKRMTTSQKPDAVMKSVLGIGPDELYANWKTYVKSRAWSLVKNRPDPARYGEKLFPDAARAAVSPDSKQVAVLGGGELRLYDPATKKKRILVKRPMQTQGSGLAWSPDGSSIAFCFRQQGAYRLGVLDVKTRRLRQYAFDDLPLVHSPVFTPDGTGIVLSGYDLQRTDLYLFRPGSGTVEPLTRDEATESWPCFGSGGRMLYYVRETGGQTHLVRLPLGDGPAPIGNPEPIGEEGPFVSSLHFSGGSLYFTSDRDERIFNLYRADAAARDTRQLTDTYADVISAAPAPDGSAVYAVLYEKGATALYRFESSQLEQRRAGAPRLDYLSNTFRDAGRLLARRPPAKEPAETVDAIGLPTLAPLPGATPASDPPRNPPARVTGLKVSEETNLVLLKWNLPLPGKDEVDTYRVYRAVEPGGEFKYLGSTMGGRKDRFADYTVQNGIRYRYYVTAVNGAGEGPACDAVEANPRRALASRDYRFKASPDLLLFLAGYDSSFGFAGGGVAVLSDYLGDHRLALLGDAIPHYRSGLQVNYEYAAWRTTMGMSAYTFRNFYRLYDLNTGSVVDDFRENERGADLYASYPFGITTRLEYGVGTQRFQGRPASLRFSEGLSNRFLEEVDREQAANYYRTALVIERRGARRFTPVRGYAMNLTFLHAPPVFDSNVTFRNLIGEVQWYRTFGFLGDLTWANRWVGLRSMGPQPQTFFLGNDEIFQSFFTTMRGYGRLTSYGSHLGLWNLELRYPVAAAIDYPLRPLSFILLKDVELALFSDTGVVADRARDLNQRHLLNSVGGGLRLYNFLFQRALVQLRFDLAWRTDRSGPPVFHFNLAPLF